MKYLKGTLIAVVVIASLPLVGVGILARFARESYRAGEEFCEDTLDWLNEK